MRTIEQIDAELDAVFAAVETRAGGNLGDDAGRWQAAWNAAPDLLAKETALFIERDTVRRAALAKAVRS